MTKQIAHFNPRMKVAYFTARQHAIGGAYVARLHHTTEELLDRLETEHDDEVYRNVCRQFGIDPIGDPL